MKLRETHGMRRTSEYQIWSGMVQRCTNPSNPSYSRYGGAGIGICDEWRDSFLAFFAHVGPRPSRQHTLDRKDNLKGYEPGNVRWATALQQAQNQRTTVFLTVFGQTHCMSEWGRILGLNVAKICWRLQQGWSHEAALSTRDHTLRLTPAQVNEARSLVAGGATRKDIAIKYGVSHSAICRAVAGLTHPDTALDADIAGRIRKSDLRRNRLLTINDETATLAEWSRRSGIAYSAILKRIDRLGWSAEDAVETPSRRRAEGK